MHHDTIWALRLVQLWSVDMCVRCTLYNLVLHQQEAHQPVLNVAQCLFKRCGVDVQFYFLLYIESYFFFVFWMYLFGWKNTVVDEQLDKSYGWKCAVCIWYFVVCILYILFLLYGSVLTSGYIRGVVVQAKLSHAKGDLHTNQPACLSQILSSRSRQWSSSLLPCTSSRF